MDTARPNQDPKVLWWHDVRRKWPIYVAGLMSMLLTNGTEIMAPKTLQWIIDALFALAVAKQEASAKLAFGIVLTSAWIFIGVAFLGLVGRVLWRMTFARMTHIASNSMKCGIWEAISETPIEQMSRYSLGDLMNRSIGDVNAARWIYGFTMVPTCDTLFVSLLGSASMIAISPKLALSCLATFIIIPPVALRMARREYDAHNQAQMELTTLSEHVSQSVRGIRAQRASNSFQSWVDALSQSAARYARLRLKAQSIAINSYPICSLPTILSYVILMLLGSRMVVAHEISMGEFVALASYVYLLQSPLAEIGELVSEWQRGFASLKRIAEIRDLPVMENSRSQSQSAFLPQGLSKATESLKALDIQSPSLDVIDLSLSSGDKKIFDHVSFSLLPSQWLGIYGDVGCGKSSLLRLLSGLTTAQSGIIKLHGVQITRDRRATIPGKNAFGHLVYAPEKPFVFGGTVRHNLLLSQQFSDDELWRVLEIVCLADEIRRLPKGLDGVVGEGGVALSGGQRQRLALARILLRPSALVLLDDPLSAVDITTENHIIRNLKSEWNSQMVVWSSNKLSTLACCDQTARLTALGLRYDQEKRYVFGRKTKEGDVLHG